MSERLIYENPLACPSDMEGFILEGQAQIGFDGTCMTMKNALAGELGQKANYVLWCPEEFPENIRVEWEFKPVTDHGLCILFFAASGKDGKDLFDPSLSPRTGEYPQYHSGIFMRFMCRIFAERKQMNACSILVI